MQNCARMWGSMGAELLGPAHHQEGGADGLLVSPSKCMSTTEELLMSPGEEKGNATIRRLAMLFCGSVFGKNGTF